MGLFAKSDKRKTTKNFKFRKLAPQSSMKLENQDGVTLDCTLEDVERYLQIMLDDTDQFVTLSLPSAPHGIRFIQACRVDKGIEVELALEKADHNKLICKICSEKKCRAIFREFFTTANVRRRIGFKPIRMMI